MDFPCPRAHTKNAGFLHQRLQRGQVMRNAFLSYTCSFYTLVCSSMEFRSIDVRFARIPVFSYHSGMPAYRWLSSVGIVVNTCRIEPTNSARTCIMFGQTNRLLGIFLASNSQAKARLSSVYSPALATFPPFCLLSVVHLFSRLLSSPVTFSPFID